MLTDVDFDARTHCRSLDPSTSHAAAQDLAQFARGHCKTILAALEQHGPMTVDEIAKVTRLNSQQINKRLPDLQRRKWARPTGQTRKSDAGRDERVWERATPPLASYAQLTMGEGG